MSWESRNCLRTDIDPDIFFSRDPDHVMLALTLCGRCPVRTACREMWQREIAADPSMGYAIAGNMVFA